MKKWLALLLAMLLPAAAAAENTVAANAVVRCQQVVSITAPCSGVLLPFDWKTGDSVNAEDVLFELNTAKVYAPVDGTVRAVFAEQGDQAEMVQAQYGMLAAVEKNNSQIVNASIEGAYSKAENRIIHVGERVYLEQVYDRDNEGEGRVVAVDGKNYVIEVTSGEFDNHVNMEIYRDPACSTRFCIGTGRTDASPEMAVRGSGYVLRAAVEEGDEVKKGDVLFELVAQDADNTLASAALNAPVAGALELAIAPGMQVYKGQLLAKIHDLSVMEVVASVDEMDLDLVQMGRSMSIVFDRYPDQVVSGIVTAISRIGTPKQNATYYDVTISVNGSMDLLPGMNAVVYLQ